MDLGYKWENPTDHFDDLLNDALWVLQCLLIEFQIGALVVAEYFLSLTYVGVWPGLDCAHADTIA